jgi:hypothetical protein
MPAARNPATTSCLEKSRAANDPKGKNTGTVTGMINMAPVDSSAGFRLTLIFQGNNGKVRIPCHSLKKFQIRVFKIHQYIGLQ